MLGKYYKPRIDKAQKHKTCECSHTKEQHDGIVFITKCEKCECPKYKFYKNLTFYEMYLQEKIKESNQNES